MIVEYFINSLSNIEQKEDFYREWNRLTEEINKERQKMEE